MSIISLKAIKTINF